MSLMLEECVFDSMIKPRVLAVDSIVLFRRLSHTIPLFDCGIFFWICGGDWLQHSETHIGRRYYSVFVDGFVKREENRIF